MRAVVCHDWRPFDELAVEDLPDPTPAPKGVVIDVKAAGVSFATSLVVQGKYQRKPPRPFTPGTEVAGVIESVGPEVTRFKPGDRVFAVLDWGGLAEKAAALEVNVYAMPDGLTFAEAISITNSYGTAAAALLWPHLLNLQAGETLLVHGAAGGVGIGATEIAKVLGAQVIATAGSAEKLEVVRAHGADHAINYRETSFREQVLEITGGKGVDACFDPVGGDVFTQSLRCLAVEGRISPIGFASGDIPAIPANLLLVKNISVVGLNMGYYMGWSPHDARYESEARIRALMDQLSSWRVEGHIHPTVAGAFPLDRFKDAMAMVLGRQAIGRVALVFDEEAARYGL